MSFSFAAFQLRLGKYLPIKYLLALQSTCRDIHNTLNDNLFWHDLCQRDFDKTGRIKFILIFSFNNQSFIFKHSNQYRIRTRIAQRIKIGVKFIKCCMLKNKPHYDIKPNFPHSFTRLSFQYQHHPVIQHIVLFFQIQQMRQQLLFIHSHLLSIDLFQQVYSVSRFFFFYLKILFFSFRWFVCLL